MLTVLLNNGDKYTLRLVRLIKVSGQPYRILSFILTNIPKYSFNEDPHSSNQVQQSLQNYLRISSIDTNSFRVQTEASNSNIYRITYLLNNGEYN